MQSLEKKRRKGRNDYPVQIPCGFPSWKVSYSNMKALKKLPEALP
jgi:hypothetical protein